LNLAELEDSHVPVCSRNGEHRVVVGEVHRVDLAGQVVDRAEGLVVVALVEQLDLV
jgi:predicted RNA-binding protein